MAPQRKRENRENQFYDVGVQGRKTGITLADRGVYDEHGLEPISGIFSSPEKSPPKRGGTVTASESMDLQESSIPDLATSHQILRNSRTHFPPPRSRSPKKTALGSSPRRQSSMAPRGSSIGPSSPIRAASHPTARRLDFEHDESSLQEAPALSGSGQRRGKRSNVYDIPEDESPAPGTSAVLEESFVQQEITANEDSVIFNGVAEESSIANVGDDTTNGAEAVEDLVDLDQSEVISEPVIEPKKRGRKRKSDVLEQTNESVAHKSRKPDTIPAQNAASQKRGKKGAPVPTASSRRPKRVSNITEQESSILEASVDASVEPVDDSETAPPSQPKRRGRPPRSKPAVAMPPPTKPPKSTTAKANMTGEFKKPANPGPKPKEKSTAKGKANAQSTATDQIPTQDNAEPGKFVDVYGHPLSKKDIEEMSTASVGSRYGRGRHLSVFRDYEPEAIARIGRTGRHRVAPIDFWKNDRIAYDTEGNMTSVVKNHDTEPERKPTKSWSRGKKRTLAAVEEDVELEPWEEEGTLTANFKDYDSARDITTDDIVTDEIAWAQKGTQLNLVGDGSFHFKKLSGAGSFLNWGLIELTADQMKRTKNCRRMHMVFTLQSGTVEAKVNDNEFTVHKGGIWQVPRGNTYSIKNVGSGTARIFFAQACEVIARGDE